MTGSPAAMRSVLRKDDVFTKAGNGLIRREFRAEVIILSRMRKHFDNDLRIENEFLSLQILGLHFAANDRYVRVTIRRGRRNLQPQVRRKRLAPRAFELFIQPANQIAPDCARLRKMRS